MLSPLGNKERKRTLKAKRGKSKEKQGNVRKKKSPFNHGSSNWELLGVATFRYTEHHCERLTMFLIPG